jgi:hypothetical protein
MNDDELITLVRAQRDKIPLTVPVEAIVTRGRALRTRRRIPRVLGVVVLALAAGVVAVSALAPASPGGQQTTVRLAAWTVAKMPDGNISVTIRELKDPAGLQSTLRADGVPASVTFLSRLNPACHLYPGEAAGPANRPWPPLLTAVFPTPYKQLRFVPGVTPSITARVSIAPVPAAHAALITIDRAALPSNAGVRLAARSSGTGFALLLPVLVYASAGCTGT